MHIKVSEVYGYLGTKMEDICTTFEHTFPRYLKLKALFAEYSGC